MKKFFEKIIEIINESITIPQLLILIGCLILFIGIIVLIIGLYRYNKKELKSQINEQHNIRHLTIDVLNRTIYGFLLSKTKKSEICTLQEYFSFLDPQNFNQLNKWLLNQCDETLQTDYYLEIVNFNSDKNSYFSHLFVIRNINKDAKLIHLDYLYYNLHNKKAPNNPYIKLDYEIERCFFKLKKNSLTAIALISFIDTSLYAIQNNYCLDKLRQRQILDILIKHADKNHLITEYKNGDFGIIILNYHPDDDFLEKINDELSKFYEVKGLDNQGTIISVYINKGQKIVYNECIKKVKTLTAHLLDTTYTPFSINYYDDNKKYVINNQKLILERVKKQIKEKAFYYEVKPYFKASTATVGCIEFTIHPDKLDICNDDNINMFIHNSASANEYLQLYLEKINDYYSDNNKEQLSRNAIIYLSRDLISILVQNIDDLKNRDTVQYIVGIDYQKINKIDKQFIDDLKLLNEYGIKILFKLHSFDTIDFELIDLATYFLFDDSLISTSIKDSFINILMNSLFSLLIKNKKTLIASSLTDWNMLETLICLEVSLFSGICLSNDISPDNRLSKRTATKLKEIYHKYY